MREKFFEWLSQRTTPAQLSEMYITFADIEQITDKKFFEITNQKELNELIKDKKFARKKNLSKINSAIKYYQTYLKENHIVEDKGTDRKDFIRWLKQRNYNLTSIMKCTSAISQCEELINKKLFATEDVNELLEIKKMLLTTSLKNLSDKQQTKYLTAFDELIEYKS